MAQQEETNVPAIRFCGFEDEWGRVSLGEVLTERNVLQKISEDAPILAFASGQGVIDRSERKSNNRDHLTLDQANKLYKLTEYDDIVYNPANLKYGAIDRNKRGRGVISPIYVTFTTEQESSFIEPIIKTERFKLRALLFEEGTVVKRQSVSPENLLSLEIGIPFCLKEQGKIGSYFKSLDRMIGLHQRKHDKLVTLKQAMLQKMFPQDGDTPPEIRFKGFKEPWKLKRFDDVATLINGRAYSQHELLDKGRYRVLRVGNFYTNSSWYYSDLELAEKYYAENGDFLYTWSASFGPHIWNGEKVIYHYHIWKVELSETLRKKFALQLLQIDRERILSTSSGSTMVHITKGGMEAKEFLVPTPEEQEKIGTYFSKVDELVFKHATQLEKLKNIKSACLEKMFV